MPKNHSKQPLTAMLATYITLAGVLIGIAVLLSAWFVPGGISGWLCGQEVGLARVIHAITYQPRPGSDHLGSANVRLLGKAVALFQLGRLVLFYLLNLAIASLWIGPSIAIGRALRPKPPAPVPSPARGDQESEASSNVQTLLESRRNSDLI